MALLAPSCVPRANTASAVYPAWPFDAPEAARRQQETARLLGVPVEKDVNLGGGVQLRLVLIPAGHFIMGAPYSEQSQSPVMADESRHRVTITRPYYLGKYELTQAQWQAVMGENPSADQDPDKPVEHVGWNDAQAFCRRASQKLGLTVRLPTEAEWEYACRAGTEKAFGESNDVEALNTSGWHGGNSGGKLHRVGEKPPNRWGLHDMHGNVWEWCQDRLGPYPDGPVTDPRGPADGDARLFEDFILRGGCLRNAPSLCRAASRDFDEPDDRSGFVGFRVAVDATAGREESSAAKP
jgi:formylglycine-generating enzyme required for sulfatase activity